jgi:hypothetical protein
MKRIPSISLALTLLLTAASVSLAVSSDGVDLIRGSWGGTIDGEGHQLNLYFNEFGPDPLNPDDPSMAVTSGGISIAEPGKNKRAKAEIGPMMARYEETGEGEFDVTIYGTAVAEEETFVIKLVGTIRTFGSGVTDDVAEGTWKTEFGSGQWSCSHLDRRRVRIPAITADSGSNFYFDVDVYSTRQDGEGEPILGTLLEVHTNVAAANVGLIFMGTVQ